VCRNMTSHLYAPAYTSDLYAPAYTSHLYARAYTFFCLAQVKLYGKTARLTRPQEKIRTFLHASRFGGNRYRAPLLVSLFCSSTMLPQRLRSHVICIVYSAPVFHQTLQFATFGCTKVSNNNEIFYISIFDVRFYHNFCTH
jgi:hypothetical protein